jgi:hypothetical protein
MHGKVWCKVSLTVYGMVSQLPNVTVPYPTAVQYSCRARAANYLHVRLSIYYVLGKVLHVHTAHSTR